ncbi:MAG: SEC-C metal-binding domain-containing protein, partial [bacterium]|nr:SEC-C metal-binding domain-containing protein [bacterium]
FQNYFRLYDKLGGMTGTAETEAEEFYQIYGLETIIMPTNKPIARDDMTDVIYKTQQGKFKAIVEEIKELHKKGQPVLVGTISVEKSELISKLLKLEGIPHNVLNAKHHEREAEIVSSAGKKGAVTIATNMAGRGTDIKIDDEVKALGGLYVLGTERHESRRIDNQLRGRSGRQGDPGASQFFSSMEDTLMRLFGADKIKNMMTILKVPEDMPIQNKLISRSIESAQKKVEGRNFDIRKHLVEYDDIMNIHRNVIYKRRQKFLSKDENKEEILEMLKEVAEGIVLNHTEARPAKEWNYKEISEALNAIHHSSKDHIENLENIKEQKPLIDIAQNYLLEAYENKEKELPEPEMMRKVEKVVFLRANDVLWMEHIDSMTQLRENVAFSGYAQKDPLTEYKSQGYEMFMEMLGMIQSNTVNTLFKIEPEKVVPQGMLARSEIKQVQTNENEIESPLSGTVTRSSFDPDDSDNPVIVKVRQATPETVTQMEKVGRNDPCPCGSGKKYKKCCGLS